MIIRIPEDERAFAADALDAMHDTVYRPWRPEPAERYSKLASLMEQQPKAAVELDASDASRIVFAARSFSERDPGRESVRYALLERLEKAFDLPADALSLQDLLKLAGRPVFVPSVGEWALVALQQENRNHDPLPELRGIAFEIDPISRGTPCVKADPYA